MSRPCKFGQNCKRPDCFFDHPGEGQKYNNDHSNREYRTNGYSSERDNSRSNRDYNRNTSTITKGDYNRNRDNSQYGDNRESNRNRDDNYYRDNRTRSDYRDTQQFRDRPQSRDNQEFSDGPDFRDRPQSRNKSQFRDSFQSRDNQEFRKRPHSRDNQELRDPFQSRDGPQYRENQPFRGNQQFRDGIRYRGNHQFNDAQKFRDTSERNIPKPVYRDGPKKGTNVRTSLLDPPRYIFSSFNVPPYNTWGFHNIHPDELRLFYYEQRLRATDTERELLDHWYKQVYLQAYNHNYELFCRALDSLPDGTMSTSKRKVDLRSQEVFDRLSGELRNTHLGTPNFDINSSNVNLGHPNLNMNNLSTTNLNMNNLSTTNLGANNLTATNFDMNSPGEPHTGINPKFLTGQMDVMGTTIPFINNTEMGTNTHYHSSNTDISTGTPQVTDNFNRTNPVMNSSLGYSNDSLSSSTTNFDDTPKTPDYTFGNIPYDRKDT